MKTTLEISDAILRRAKIVAAQEGMALKELFNQALIEKLHKPKGRKRKTKPSRIKLEGAF